MTLKKIKNAQIYLLLLCSIISYCNSKAQVESIKSDQKLYKKYFNMVNFEDEILKFTHQKPSFEVAYSTNNGVIAPASETFTAVLYPYQLGTVKAGLKENRKLLYEFKFKVIPVPLPTIEFYSNNNPKIIQAISSKTPSIHIKIIPEKHFAELLPKDANYEIKKVEIKHYRKKELVNTFTQSSHHINLSNLKLQPEDNLVIRIQQIQRIGERGNVFDVELKENTFHLAIH